MTFQERIISIIGFLYVPKSNKNINKKTKSQMFSDPQVMRDGYKESCWYKCCLVAF